MKIKCLLVIAFLTCFSHAFSQINKHSSLPIGTVDQLVIKTLKEKDSLFWVGYNTCDLDLVAHFLSSDIKFYHDKGGMTSGLTNFKKRMQQNICGDVNYKVRRELVAGSFKLFLLKRAGKIYGAIATCEQYFYHFKNGRKETKDDDIARFMSLWLLKGGDWKMHEIFSFNHEATD